MEIDINLAQIFMFWIEQVLKLFEVMKKIPIFPGISLFDLLIVVSIVLIFMNIIKLGNRTSSAFLKGRAVVESAKRLSKESDTYVGKHSAEGFAKHRRKD